MPETHPTKGPLAGGGASQFGTPHGLLGRLAGRIMASGNADEQEQLAELIDERDGDHVLEVGYGPGVLVRQLVARGRATHIAGVDPSEVMAEQARRANRAAVSAGRVDLRVAGVERVPFDNASFDRVVSVNNVQIWPDPAAGMREIHRVLRPGGHLVIALHSRRSPSRFRRRLGLDPAQLDRIARLIGDVFGEVARHDLTDVDVFVTTRS